MKSIVWDYRIGDVNNEQTSQTRANGEVAARFVWCAKEQREVPGGGCRCYMACNLYFMGPVCPPTRDGYTFRDAHD